MAPTPKPITRKDGSVVWRVRFRLEGKANPVSETFDNPDEAHRFATLVDQVGGRAARRARTASDLGAGDTLAEGFERYISKAGTNAQPDTLSKYRRNWNTHIAPHFGTWPMDAITREAVEDWVGQLRETQTAASLRATEKNPDTQPDYLSPKTIRNLHGLLSAVLKNEVVRGRLAVNVAYGIPLPAKKKKRQAVFLSEGDYAALLANIPDKWRPLITLLAGTGLRWSEATALRPVDINLDGPQPVARVTRAWKKGGTGQPWTVGAPKTEQSTRTVALSVSVAEALRGAAEGVEPGELIFQGPRGGRLSGAWFHERIWVPTVKATRLTPPPVIHDLRHSHASWLIMRGVPLPVIQRRMGHSSIKVTADTYGHLSPDAWLMATNAIEDALGQAHIGGTEIRQIGD